MSWYWQIPIIWIVASVATVALWILIKRKAGDN
jgi:hypothetical protein